MLSESKTYDKEVKENQQKYFYYNIQDMKNQKFKNKEEFEKYVAENPNENYKKEWEIFSGYHNIFYNKEYGWYIDPTFPNEKYMNDFGQEIVINKKTGEIVKDGVNDGTYNVGSFQGEDSFKGKDVHFEYDTTFWEEFGASSQDKTTKEDRKKLSSLMKIYIIDPNFRGYTNSRGVISSSVYKDYLEILEKNKREGE